MSARCRCCVEGAGRQLITDGFTFGGQLRVAFATCSSDVGHECRVLAGQLSDQTNDAFLVERVIPRRGEVAQELDDRLAVVTGRCSHHGDLRDLGCLDGADSTTDCARDGWLSPRSVPEGETALTRDLLHDRELPHRFAEGPGGRIRDGGSGSAGGFAVVAGDGGPAERKNSGTAQQLP